MQVYSELTPPTAVTHSLTLPFVSANTTNLVVAKSSLLQIFRTKTLSTELEAGGQGLQANRSIAKSTRQTDGHAINNDDDGLSFLGNDNMSRLERPNTTRLVLVAEFPLMGTVIGLARVKMPNRTTGGDALLIAFRDAKLSLVEWESQKSTLTTISIHYYEQDELRGSPWASPAGEYVNFLAAEPGSRCAALKFGARNLAILPFTQPDEDMDMDMGMDDWDEELDGLRPSKNSGAASSAGPAVSNGASIVEDTPYSPSFVLRLSNLDPSLLHPVHLAFLHEYREPTFGILASRQSPSHALGRRDHFAYMVFTLDLRQKASTTILSVTGLPQDLFGVVALPAPVGGALLLGADELIHINQSGKPHGVAVNPLTKRATDFGLVDLSHLDLRLEGCAVEPLAPEHGEFLLVLNNGRIGLIIFHLDGRTVSGLDIKMKPPEAGGFVLPAAVSTLSRLGRNTMFAGSEDGDSVVLGWSRGGHPKGFKRKPRIKGLDDFDLDDEDLEWEEDEDDLYGDGSSLPASSAAHAKNAAKSGELSFRVHDRLVSIAPIRDMTWGRAAGFLPESEEAKTSMDVRTHLDLVLAVGRDGAGSLAILNREMQPRVIGRFEFPEARGLWAMCVKKPSAKPLTAAAKNSLAAATAGHYDVSSHYDKYMIVAKLDLDGYETSDVYALTAAGFESLTGTEFEAAAGFTIEAGVMGNSMRIIQVLKSEVRCYDGNLGLSQILPMLDDETGAEPRVLKASILDPYLLLIRDDASVLVAQINSSNELEEMEKQGNTIVGTKWVSGCLYRDTDGVFAEDAVQTGGDVLIFLLSAGGALFVYRPSNLGNAIFVAEGACYIPPYLAVGYTARKGTAKEVISEVLVADLGDTTHKSPYLILRHGNDDLTVYHPIRGRDGEAESLTKTLSFQKVPNTAFAKSAEETDPDDAALPPRFLSMRACSNVGGYSTVFLPGASPSFVIKSATSMPAVVGLQGASVQAMSPFHTEGCTRGFIYADSTGIARVAQMPPKTSFAELGLSVRKMPMGVDLTALAYHTPTETYLAGCSVREEFELPRDDESHKQWANEMLPFKPTVERGILKLVNPATWTVVDEVTMDPCEAIMCAAALNLEVSEATNERKPLLAVGTAIARGQDLPIKGCIYVYDVAEVIPETGRPERNRKLKLIAKEEVARGAVTAISEVGTQGLMLVAQGQKCMVRGLKEDGTLLPVAFMDMNCYVTSVKELPGTGLCLLADAFKGVWFTGYTEEPYKMVLLGKSATNLEVLNADLLPFGKDMFLVASDIEGQLHILHYDPEHPKSLQGHLLLHTTTFHTGAHYVTSSALMPRTVSPSPSSAPASATASAQENPPRHLLLASPTGLLSTLSPIPESTYRRLASLATQLANSLPHPAALNPRAYRTSAAAAPAVDAGLGRAVVDGSLLARWSELGSGRAAEVAGRAGFSGGVHEVRAELEGVLGWGPMGYF